MNNAATSHNEIHRKRLFIGICLALVPTGASFALVANVLGQLKAEFLLTNFQVGSIAGAGLWGMAISLLILGPWLEKYGMKNGTLVAFLGHVVGLTLMIAAVALRGDPSAYWLLMLGAICLAVGNGMIEVTGNPLTTALYPDDKTAKLNWFHAFFPLGILAASLIGFGLNQLADVAPFFYHWTFQLGIVYIPIIIYGILVLPQKFPKTEYGESGLPFGEMFRYALTHPLMYVLVLMLAVAVSIELGASRWIPEIFAQLGLHGILLLAWLSLLMVLLRLYASPFVEKFSPPGMLCVGGAIKGTGLVLFAIAEGGFTAFLAATFFGIGVAFFFPTIVGLVSERLPRAGSFGIILTMGVGLLAAGAVGTPGIGWIADTQLARYMDERHPEETIEVLRDVQDAFPALIEEAEAATDEELLALGFRAADLEAAMRASQEALADYEERGAIEGAAVPTALRAIVDAPVDHPVIERAANIIGPAEGWGGQRALMFIAPLTLILIGVFGAMYINDQRKGGYKAEKLSAATTPDE